MSGSYSPKELIEVLPELMMQTVEPAEGDLHSIGQKFHRDPVYILETRYRYLGPRSLELLDEPNFRVERDIVR